MPVITISRQFGAGGKTLGDMVAQKLGYVFYDDQVIQMLATEAKVSPQWVECVENEAGGILQRFIDISARKSFLDRISAGKRGYINEEIYVELLQRIIRRIAQEGNTIILGRASQYILQDMEQARHVLLVAERADRVRFVETRYGLSRQKARWIVDRQEKRRLNLYRRFRKTDYEQPSLYHLVLNTSKISLEHACDHVCVLGENKSTVSLSKKGG